MTARGEAPSRRRLRLVEQRGDAMSRLAYRIVAPDDARPETPLVLALHGRGDTAAGFVSLARRLELDARVVVVEAPLPFGNIGGRQWFDATSGDLVGQMRQRLDELDDLVGALTKTFPAAGRPHVLGFSQGAMLAMVAALERPERILSVVAFSGRLVDGVKPLLRPDGEPEVLVVAGTRDGVIPQAASWEAADALAAAGRRVERMSFAGPHTVPDSAIEAARTFFARVGGRPPSANP